MSVARALLVCLMLCVAGAAAAQDDSHNAPRCPNGLAEDYSCIPESSGEEPLELSERERRGKQQQLDERIKELEAERAELAHQADLSQQKLNQIAQGSASNVSGAAAQTPPTSQYETSKSYDPTQYNTAADYVESRARPELMPPPSIDAGREESPPENDYGPVTPYNPSEFIAAAAQAQVMAPPPIDMVSATATTVPPDAIWSTQWQKYRTARLTSTSTADDFEAVSESFRHALADFLYSRNFNEADVQAQIADFDKKANSEKFFYQLINGNGPGANVPRNELPKAYKAEPAASVEQRKNEENGSGVFGMHLPKKDNDFLFVFLILAALNLYFSLTGRAAQLISRIGGNQDLLRYLLPPFVGLGIPLTLVIWAWVGYWALTASAFQAFFALGLGFFAFIVLPVPASITLPAIYWQIARVSKEDESFAQNLLAMAHAWEARGSRR